MPNILSHVGASLQAELCVWTVLGVINSTFDAAIFRIDANLKQVWGVRMPDELPLAVQRALRAMISGVVLVQCFTTHIYLAAYVVLLYPVFLEERPALVLPWLLVSAVRGLLCELLGLALGLASCLLVGATRSPCIIFVLGKLAKITPALYMWMLVFSYYRMLKMSPGFMTFPASSSGRGGGEGGSGGSGGGSDYGLEQAVRRRRTKSLYAEPELRRKLTTYSYGDRISTITKQSPSERVTCSTNSDSIDEGNDNPFVILNDEAAESNIDVQDSGFDEWLTTDLPLRRDSDRILDQFVVMILKVAAYLSIKESPREFSLSRLNITSVDAHTSHATTGHPPPETTLSDVEPETPPNVGSAGRMGASYLREFPKIFNKRGSQPQQFRWRDNVSYSNSACSSSTRQDRSVQTDSTDDAREISLNDVEPTTQPRRSQPTQEIEDKSNEAENKGE